MTPVELINNSGNVLVSMFGSFNYSCHFSVSVSSDTLNTQRGIVGFFLSQLEGEVLATLHTRLMSRQWQVGKTKCIRGPRSPGGKVGSLRGGAGTDASRKPCVPFSCPFLVHQWFFTMLMVALARLLSR